jgi:amino-acid N-acetyltransferase
VTIQWADSSQAKKLYALISAHLEEGHLLPRTLPEVTAHADRFVIALRGRTIVGCAELAPLSPHVAEIRSLAVGEAERGSGVGALLVDELRRRARREGFAKLCAFTHAPGYFSGMGFSIVPHLWVPEKIYTDCTTCPQFRRCGQYAMILPLDDATGRPIGDERDRPLDVVVTPASGGSGSTDAPLAVFRFA